MSTILHYRLDALKRKARRLYLRGKPYTGIVYEVKGYRVLANSQVTAGVRGGPAEAWDTARIRVVWESLITVDANDTNAEFPKEGVYVEGALFEGVAYQFDDLSGMLLEELDFHPTNRGPSREWHRSGALAADFDKMRPDGTRESVRYYENGEISGVQSDKMGWDLTPEGRLRTLLLWSGYPKKDLQRVPFRVDSRLYLASKGVTDEIVERLEDLPRLEYLRLNGTRISAKGLARFRVCVNLKEFITEKNTRFGDADVRKLLARLPGCEWKSW